ncbi:S1/P1 nuclease [Mangrovibacterium lignilyticum]|uniref:S1/P1 nuclease n=1 Tax=Mangrovibacterium lignilyticum TaxID=2668052 RepID=UPI0013D0E25E|nr:S1/P1 nuclease [Mangrovibacterium lignilyticum]
MKTFKQNYLFYLFLAAFTCLLNLSAGAWGSTGHRAVAQIAWEQLTPESKSKIKSILGDDYLPFVATWADDIRSEKDNPLGTVPHYVNMDFTDSYETAKKNANGDIVTLLNGMIDTLNNSTSTNEEKATALKFIIHLVADVHQPMHIGLAEDLGGNTVEVKWFEEVSNLHKVWDENMIDYSRLSYTELARFAGKPADVDLPKLLDSSIADWADESHEITKTIYNHLGIKSYSYAYYYQFFPVVLEQIQKAGYRLGDLLNELMQTPKQSKSASL